MSLWGRRARNIPPHPCSSSLSLHTLLHSLGSIGCTSVGFTLSWAIGDRETGHGCASRVQCTTAPASWAKLDFVSPRWLVLPSWDKEM